MSECRVTVDACKYQRKNNGTCIITGWLYTGDLEPEVQVRADYAPISCRVVRTERPDVLAALPQLSFPDVNAGFEIYIENIENLFSLAEFLRVRFCCGKESIPVMQKTMEQVKKEYYQDTLQYYMECVEKRLDKVHIQGWCVDAFGGYALSVVDEKGKIQEEVSQSSVRRPDLKEVFGVDADACHGFILEIPRNRVKSKKLIVEFKNGAVTKQEIIDMRRFDRENTRIGRIARTVGKENREKNQKIKKALGLRGFLDYVWEESSSFADAYETYAKKHSPSGKELRRQAKENFSYMPLFSIVVPLYHTPVSFLKEMIDSVIKQSYGNWQLCLADGSSEDTLGAFIQANYGKDRRIFYKHLKENTGISGNTNAALEMAEGDFIVFADHDDVIAPDALYEMAVLLKERPDGELIYTDEDLMDKEGNLFYPHFKPDFNLDYLRCINYICHLVAVKKELLEKAGTLRPEFDGAQDYDFLLRCVEHTEHIYHIPKVLYHWRSHEGSTAGNQDSKNYAVEAGKRALSEHYKRCGLLAEAEFTGIFIVYRTKFKVQGNPKVSILIPNKDHIEDLEKCISSVMEKSTWENKEIIVIENNSVEKETFAYYERLKQQYANVKVVVWEGEFNYSAINNFGAKYAEGDYYLLLNNDTEVITPDWLEQMLGYCQREDTAIAGAKLLYPDDTVQHAGVVVGMGGFAGHILTGFGKNPTGYMGRLAAAQEVSAVTGACLMVKKAVFDELSGLDGENFKVALNDVDFCLRAGKLHKKVVFLPDVQLYHYESKSRGFETTPEKQERFQKEIDAFQKRYGELLEAGDPYYNPNLSLVRGDCSLAKRYETWKGRKA